MAFVALIQDGRVAGILPETIEVEGTAYGLEDRFPPDQVAACVPIPAGQVTDVAIGWTYTGGVFGPPSAAPPAPAPAVRVASVRAVAFRLALAAMPPPPGSPAGIVDMEDAANAAVAGAPKAVRIAWQHGSRVMRSDLVEMGPALGAAWTTTAIDAALAAAAALPDADPTWEPVP